jgi:hypothetical protein
VFGLVLWFGGILLWRELMRGRTLSMKNISKLNVALVVGSLLAGGVVAAML